MKVLVTGAAGFVGSNLCAALDTIADGRDSREELAALLPLTVYRYDTNNTPDDLERLVREADFVFHLAGVNRPQDPAEFRRGNAGLTEQVVQLLERHGNTCPVMLASSVQATLEGRYAHSDYGTSKLEAERLLQDHARRTGAQALIYRFPNVFGKWCRPNYNSAVATFCHNVAHDLPVTVSDPSLVLELLYIDDLVNEMLMALLGKPHAVEGGFCEAVPTHTTTLQQIVDMLHGFKEARASGTVPNLAEGSLSKKLYSTYMSYLDPKDLAYDLVGHEDERGSFTEFLRTPERGQVSVNVVRPGFTKGRHWHHSKWEKFLVVSGEGCVRLRRVGTDAQGEPFPVTEFRVDAGRPTVVETAPGYAHSITNTSDTHDMVVLIWCNEPFDPARPDTFFEEV